MKNNLILFIILYIIFFESCTVRLPAITFTQSGTAAEKQMIGNDKEIENYILLLRDDQFLRS